METSSRLECLAVLLKAFFAFHYFSILALPAEFKDSVEPAEASSDDQNADVHGRLAVYVERQGGWGVESGVRAYE